MKKTIFGVCTALSLFVGMNAFSQKNLQSATGSWGDQGNGTYINPVLDADYSDPDVIRVGEDFYMVSSEFHFMGMPVLHSKDLVNWTIIGRVYDEFKFDPKFDTNERYAGGCWAPAIRFHGNKFWIYFCTPDEGLFMTVAEKPEGPWEPLTQVVDTAGWEDPCPFWDEDGQAYLGHSKKGAGPIYIHKMSSDGKKLLDAGSVVYTGPVAEGTKFLKLDWYYYLSIPEGGVSTGWQTVLRSKNIYGPYEKRVVLEKGLTSINGPHQGALVDLPNGDWWFVHFQESPNIGRVCHLEPVRWKDGWPIIGADLDLNGIGEPVYVYKKPDVGKVFPITAPQASDEFNGNELGFQWAWNHNPVPGWSLAEKPGFLSLEARHSPSFLKAKNTLTQKTMGPEGEATTLLITDEMKDGQKAGLCLMGKQYNLVGVVKSGGKLSLFTDINGKMSEVAVRAGKVYLRVQVTTEPGANLFFYSTDNKQYFPAGEKFAANNGFWKGPKIGLFCYNEKGEGGTALFDWFHYDYDGPKAGK
jgi:beta-xylosidase